MNDYIGYTASITFFKGGWILFLKYSAKAEFVETVSTGIAQSKKHASCPCPGRWRSTESTLSTPTDWSILARSKIEGRQGGKEGKRRMRRMEGDWVESLNQIVGGRGEWSREGAGVIDCMQREVKREREYAVLKCQWCGSKVRSWAKTWTCCSTVQWSAGHAGSQSLMTQDTSIKKELNYGKSGHVIAPDSRRTVHFSS